VAEGDPVAVRLLLQHGAATPAASMPKAARRWTGHAGAMQPGRCLTGRTWSGCCKR